MGTFLVMKNNFKRSFRHKLLFLATFLLPVVLCMLLGMIEFGKTSLRVGILEGETNPSNTFEKEELYEILEQSEGIRYSAADEASINTDLIMGKFQLILDYRGSNIVNQFQLLSNQPDNKKVLLQTVFREAIINKEAIRLEGLKENGLSVTERSTAALLTMFLVFSVVHAAAIIGDKNNGTMIRYQYARKNSSGYLMGYALYTFLITLIQMLMCIAALLLLQKNFILTWREAVILSILITVISTIYAVIICAISKSEVQANIVASSIAALLSLLGGTFVAVEAMPGLLRWISFASPIRWVVELLRIL